MKYVSIDIESTGLNHETCDILEFAAVLDDTQVGGPLTDLPTFHCYFLSDVYHGEPYALSMHPTIFRRIADREPPYTYVRPMKFGFMFKKFLMENGYPEESGLVYINIAGKNPGSLDIPFLRMKTDIDKHVRIRHKVLDPAILFFRDEDDQLPGLGECKARAEMVDIEVKHDALSDAMDVVELLRIGLRK